MSDSDMIGLVIGGIIGLACLGVWIFYLLTLHTTMNAVDPAHRPLPGGLAWLSLIPFLGSIWLIVYVLLLSSAVDRDLQQRNLGPGSQGITIAFVVLMVLMIIPYLNVLALIPFLVLWIIHWLKMAEHKRQLLGH